MKHPATVLSVSLIAVVLIAIIAVGPLMSQVEQPAYTVERTDGAIELRSYPPLAVAKTIVDGSRGPAINKGFRILANYIFGANDGAKKIEMTAPVMQDRVVSSDKDGAQPRAWNVRFVMPHSWSARLPRPTDGRVTLETVPAAIFVVIRFAGFARDNLLEQRIDQLKAFIAREKLSPKGEPIYAFYNPPWTLPFFRRNEVMIQVAAFPPRI